jgi:hypothetical protein
MKNDVWDNLAKWTFEASCKDDVHAAIKLGRELKAENALLRAANETLTKERDQIMRAAENFIQKLK